MNHDYLIAIIVRLIVFFIGRTSYVPDEYFQFVEPALKAAYSVETMYISTPLPNIKVINLQLLFSVKLGSGCQI